MFSNVDPGLPCSNTNNTTEDEEMKSKWKCHNGLCFIVVSDVQYRSKKTRESVQICILASRRTAWGLQPQDHYNYLIGKSSTTNCTTFMYVQLLAIILLIYTVKNNNN